MKNSRTGRIIRVVLVAAFLGAVLFAFLTPLVNLEDSMHHQGHINDSIDGLFVAFDILLACITGIAMRALGFTHFTDLSDPNPYLVYLADGIAGAVIFGIVAFLFASYFEIRKRA